jgi:hypothetical protein
VVSQPVNPHRTGDVLDLLLAHVLEGEVEPVSYLITDDPADADPARLGQGLQSRRDIHPIAEDVVLLDNHVAEIDADAEPDASLLRHLRLAVEHPTLDLHSAAHGVHHTGEFREEPVAGVLYDPAPVLRDLRIDQLPEIGFEALVGPPSSSAPIRRE